MSYRDTPKPDQEAQARAIASVLGQDWTLANRAPHDAEYTDWHLCHKDGYELDLTWPTIWNNRPARLEIRGVWPIGKDNQVRLPSQTDRAGHKTMITVDQTRLAEAIAKDITRRLLPSFLPLWERAKQLTEDGNRYIDQTEATIRALVATGGRRSEHQNAVYFDETSYLYKADVSGDSVRFESISVPLAIALRVIPAFNKPR